MGIALASTLQACSSESASGSNSGIAADEASASLSVVVDGTTYDATCGGKTRTDGSVWHGPQVDVMSSNASCSWPKENSSFTLTVLFAGDSISSEGFAPGAYDLADPGVSAKIVVLFVASAQSEVTLGSGFAYANYSSSSVVDGPGSSSEAGPLASGAKGIVSVTGNKVGSQEISLENVTLPVLKSDAAFPSSVKIISATLIW